MPRTGLRLKIVLFIGITGCFGYVHAQDAGAQLPNAPIANADDASAETVQEAVNGDADPETFDTLPMAPETTVTPPQNRSSNTGSGSPLANPGSAPVAVPAQVSSNDTGNSTSANGTSNVPSNSVVTDSRSLRPGNQVGSSMTVISREAIRNTGQASVAAVLRSVPGLDVVSQGGPGQQTSVFMRGANSNQTKVMLDGMPMNDPGSPGRGFDFSTLTVDEVERIEVLRGPQSTLYGSDAIGGVINIITRKGGEPITVVSSEGGSFSSSRTTARTAGGNDRLYYALGGSYNDTNGFSAAALPPGNTEADFYRNGTISGRLGWQATEQLAVDIVARHTDSDTGTDGFPPPTFTLQDDLSSLEQVSTVMRAQATWTTADGIWSHRLGSGYSEFERTFFSDFGGTFYGRTGRLDWQNDLLLVDQEDVRWQLTSGIDFLEEVARNDTVPQARQGNLAGYFQTNIDLNDRLFLGAGARWDDYSRAGSAFTYRITGRYNATEATALHGAIGTGFRAPALDELLGLVGNPLLNPEQSKGWEAGVQQRLLDQQITLDATYFRNDFNDLIQFEFDPLAPGPFGGTLQNVKQALASGVELTSLWALTDETTLFANYTFTDTRDRSTGDPLLRRPKNKWAFGFSRYYPNNRANVTLQALYVGDRTDVGTVLDDYWFVNLAAWYRFNESWRTFGRIDNLLAQDYQPVAGYQGTPFSAYAGLELRF
ncbi:Vitamin B12 transporter BtuB precursor [Roseimaritima multifibrata]|uniref:Vitamin B12 transporter BtuB n=1 Tax=Roseimaritima multifibrata TaxID=1930274 RepID=A0A517MJU1_9BACT|nr:TonB-dependent receptor [Roseimaritima multifibrata]QDS95161.1 Vitamin B12 transporter BtuB precursor [Roseimaritima multifibrata]